MPCEKMYRRVKLFRFCQGASLQLVSVWYQTLCLHSNHPYEIPVDDPKRRDPVYEICTT
mgnify:FL=1